jgi:hypothetical protein
MLFDKRKEEEISEIVDSISQTSSYVVACCSRKKAFGPVILFRRLLNIFFFFCFKIVDCPELAKIRGQSKREKKEGGKPS